MERCGAHVALAARNAGGLERARIELESIRGVEAGSRGRRGALLDHAP